jgi:hypothetical protein
MAFFWTKERLLKKSTLRIIYLALFVACFIATELGRRVYRPYIYRNEIDDWGMADSIGNSLGTLTQIFLYLGLANATQVQSYRIIGFVTVGYIAYEVVQPILPRGTFDWADIIATLAAGCAATMLVGVVHHYFPESAKSAEHT